MALRLRPLDDAIAPAWDAFVAAMPDGTFFHRAAWSRVIATAFGHRCHYTLAEQDGAIVGVLPLAHVRTTLFGNTLVSTPFCVYGGPLAVDPQTAAALDAHADELREKLGASALELRERQPAEGDWLVRPDLYVTFRKPIAGDHERNMKAIPRKQRAMVRKGIQNGLVSVCNHDMAVLHRVYAESVRNLGTPVFSRRYFTILNEAFADCSDVVTVLDAENPIASVMNFYFRDEVLPYYGGGTARARRARGQRLHVLGGDAACRCPRLPPVRLRSQQAGHRCVRLQAQLGIRAGTAALSLPSRARWEDPGPQSAQPEIPAVHRGVEASAAGGGQSARAADRARARLSTMRDLLFLSHRIPYPPDKGDKIRAWNIFRYLARTHRIHLGCFIDDPVDRQHLAVLGSHCADLLCVPLDPRVQRLKALLRMRPGQPLSLGYFRDRGLQRWVDAKLAGGTIDSVYVFSSAMAGYVMHATGVRRILDMVDVDSEKWTAYAATARFPTRNIWAREGRTLLAFERHAAAHFDHSLFVSEHEWQRFVTLAPETAQRTGWVANGVDFDHFSPAHHFAPPFAGEGADLVFTGRMDYRPNIDAVQWFAREVLPVLRQRVPAARFWIVGAAPSSRCARLPNCPAFTSPAACPTPGRISPPPMSWWRRCASPAASRTSCSRRWRWRDRWSPRRKHLRACARSLDAISCWQAE